MWNRSGSLAAGVLVAVMAGSMPLAGQHGAKNGEWPYYGGDAGSTKYAPLDQINKTNVKDLRIAWRWKADNFGSTPDFNYEATPLMVGGVLYVTAGSRRDVVAIDAATGETLWMWRLDEGRRALVSPRFNSGRGVAYWTDGKEARILHVTPGYRLVALDAKTGRQIPQFGKAGIVDLYEGLDRPAPEDGQIGLGSPPMVVGDVAVVGAAHQGGGGGANKENIAGFIRGYDVRTGKRIWIFHTIPKPGEFGNDTWENDSWSYTGNTGAWAPMAADLELGYVYVPVEAPTNDMYGGHRLGNGLFAESLVCLEAKTGKRVWHYQLVHHGIWDYDLPTTPTLLDITVDGRRIKAVAQVTKQAHTYVFDRVTGQPVWPIEERAVPQSDVPGERTSPTQPHPTKPPPFDRQGITVDDLIDFTPELRAEAIRIAAQYKTGPIFTPPIVAGANGLKGLLMMPGAIGGANWQGAAVDAETGILYVGSLSNPQVRALAKDPKSNMNFSGSMLRVGSREGCGDMGPQGLPLLKPLYGRITAIDLNSGTHLWVVPNGETPDCIKNHPALKGVNLPNTGSPDRAGIVVTKTLVFAGEGGVLRPSSVTWGGGPRFRAYDKSTGAIVSEFNLPGNQASIPMTYMAGGKQFIVVAVAATGQPAELVALTVP
jgi:quinoprotein glucose dehydrogenase